MSRKFRSGGSTSEQALSRSKKYKYNSAGTLVEATSIADDDIIFSGSKSNLRRMADLERNISILANKILTTDGNAEDADDANFNNKFTDDVRFKAETRFDDTMLVKTTIDATAGTVNAGTLQIDSKTITATGDELNILDGATVSTAELNKLDGATVSTAELNILDGATVSTAELNYMDGVTSNVQTQINTKAPTANPTFTGTVSGVSKSHVGLGNVTNESKATMFASPTFTGTATAAAVTTSGDVAVGGNLTVSGTTTTVNTETINLADNVILVNSNATGTPTENGGIEVERGSSSNVSFVWDEASDKWTVGTEAFVAGTVEATNLYGNLTGDVDGDILGNAATATTLATARTIGGVSFNGSANINLPGVNTTGNQDTSGNATTASAWQTARTLSLTGAVTGSASVDGSGNVSLATTATADPTLTLTGDVSGSATFTNLGNATLTVTVADDSHNHITSNIDGFDAAVRTEIQGADLNLGTNKVLYSNVYSATGDLPSASSYHGMFAHVHGTGLAYYAHAGNWVALAKNDDKIASNANDTASGIITFSNSTNSTSSSTGAVKITGGLGVGGNIYAGGDVTAYSDESLKTNIKTIANGLDKVMALRGITFDRIADGSTSTGVSAQDVAAVLPEAVATDNEGLLAVKYGNLVGLLIEAIKDLKSEVNELKAVQA